MPASERAHVEGKDGGILQHLGNVAVDDLARQTFGNGRLADTGVTDEQGIVLLPPTQHLDGPQHLALAPDQGIDAAALGLLVEIDAIGVERVLGLLLLVALAAGFLLFIDTTHVLGVGHARPLGDAVANVLHRVEAGHFLLLQEERRVALALGENRHQHIGTRHLFPPRGLHVHDGAMNDALEAGRGLRVRRSLDEQPNQLVVEILGNARPQAVEIDRTRPHHRRGVSIIQERQQQVLERRVLVVAIVGMFDGAMQRRFQALGECGHVLGYSFSMVHCRGC